ncbi:MAG: metallophosphoesterase [Desulfurococcales archaeon]|nr:metallophosphoesterase [Desulfurococcales archaeon]
MVLVGVISDTHDNISNTRKAAKIFKDAGVDIVLHLGDIVAPFTLMALAEVLEGIRVVGIYGNNCGEKLGLQRVAQGLGVELYEPPHELMISGKRILMVHGYGSPDMTKSIVYSIARGGEWDIILYGHTHMRDKQIVEGKLVLNPGEAAGVLDKPSIALLDIQSMDVRFIEL